MGLTETNIINAGVRAERKKDQICSGTEYRKTFERLSQLPQTVEHLVIQLGTLVLSILTTVMIYEAT